MPGAIHSIRGLLISAKEIRFMVYKEFLAASFSSSPSLAVSKEYKKPPPESKSTEPGDAPAVHLLRTSKVINEEASLVFYSRSFFVALNYTPRSPEKDETKGLWFFFGAAQFEKKLSGEVELGQRFRQKLIRDVARTFKPKREQLPLWLFGGYYIRFNPVAGRIWEENFPNSLGPFPGYVFPGFLRQIGPSNTANIKDLQFKFPRLSRACHDFPLYAEIVRQHIFGLKKLSIRTLPISYLQLRWRVTATMNLNLRERKSRPVLMRILRLGIECRRCAKGIHSSFFDDDASMKQPDGYRAVFLSEIRLLLKDLPYLEDLKLIFDCCWLDGELKEMESLLLQEKLEGSIFDLHKTWKFLDEKITRKLYQIPGYQVATSA